MEVFLTVVVVFGIVVGIWQPWGTAEFESSGHIYCVSSDFKSSVSLYPAYATARNDTKPVSFDGKTYHRGQKPAITGIGIDYFEMVDGQAMLHFTDFGVDALAKATEELRGQFLSVVVHEKVVAVLPVGDDMTLDEDMGLVIGTPVKVAESICP